MLYRDFKGQRLSALGLGTMRLPIVGDNYSVIDEAAATELFDYAYTHGINYFDTAWGYHDGNAERMVGKALSRYPRDSYFLATKFPGYDNSNMDKVEEIFEEQLRKCQTPYFDFYLFHNVYEGNIDDYLNPRFGILEYLLKQKQNGRIRHLGFSTHGSLDVMRRFVDAYGKHMEFCQIQLNYMDWHFQNAEGKVEYLRKSGIPIWVMEPLRGGKLASVSEKLSALIPRMSAPELAFRFLQSVSDVTVTLSGMSNMVQLRENIATWENDAPLSEGEFAALVSLCDEETKKNGLPCTACHYCTTHCPQSLPIPELIALHNENALTEGGFIAPMAIASMPEAERPANCLACRACEQVCPQGIKISDAMKALSAATEM